MRFTHACPANFSFELSPESMHPLHAEIKESAVKIELESGRLQLTRGQILKVRDGAGRTVCARQGWIWITEENQPNDIVLEPGGCYRLRRGGGGPVPPGARH